MILISLPLAAVAALALPEPLGPNFPAAKAAAAPAADPFAPALYGAPLPVGWLALQDAPEEPVGPQTGFLASWDGSVNLGGVLSSGNTDVRAAQADILGVQEHKEGEDLVDRWTVKGYWNYTDRKNQLTDNNELVRRQAGVLVKYDRFFSKTLYGYGNGALDTDKIASLNLRSTIGAGLGYQFYDDEEFKLSGEAGLAYVTEDYQGSSVDGSFLAARAAWNLFWQIHKELSFRQFAELFPSLEDPDDIYGRFDSRFTMLLSKSLTASLGHLWLYDNTPLAGNERSDHIVSLSLGWVF